MCTYATNCNIVNIKEHAEFSNPRSVFHQSDESPLGGDCLSLSLLFDSSALVDNAKTRLTSSSDSSSFVMVDQESKPTVYVCMYSYDQAKTRCCVVLLLCLDGPQFVVRFHTWRGGHERMNRPNQKSPHTNRKNHHPAMDWQSSFALAKSSRRAALRTCRLRHSQHLPQVSQLRERSNDEAHGSHGNSDEFSADKKTMTTKKKNNKKKKAANSNLPHAKGNSKSVNTSVRLVYIELAIIKSCIHLILMSQLLECIRECMYYEHATKNESFLDMDMYCMYNFPHKT